MFYGRFAFAMMSQAEFLAAFDNDTIPGTHWLRNCVDAFRDRPALLGSIGVTMEQSDRYAPNTRTGWIGEGPTQNQEVDLAGHAWFLPRDWLRYFWYEKPSTFLTGEDMHMSFSFQKHLGVPTVIPAHPAGYPQPHRAAPWVRNWAWIFPPRPTRRGWATTQNATNAFRTLFRVAGVERMLDQNVVFTRNGRIYELQAILRMISFWEKSGFRQLP